MNPRKLKISDERITIEPVTDSVQARFSHSHSGGDVLATEQLEAALNQNDISKLPQLIQPYLEEMVDLCDGGVGQVLWESAIVQSFNHIFENKDRTNLSDLLFEAKDVKRETIVPLFETEKVDYKDESRYAVSVKRGGQNNRPLLQRSQNFNAMIEHVGKTIVIQYAILNQDATVDNSPFFSEEALQRIIDFVEDYAWVYHDGYAHRMPVSTDTPLDGFLYLMYRLSEDTLIPKYIGIARREVDWSDGLNTNIAGVNQDSKRGRWGDSYSNHIGGLSLACFRSPENREPSKKYLRWMRDIFLNENCRPVMVEGKPLLRNQIYIDTSPWLDHDVEQSERNLIKIAHGQFPEEILNDVHAQ